MNWQNEAVEDLKKYAQMKESLINIHERIAALESDYTGIKSMATNEVPIRGGSSKNEARLINNIVERERLECTYNATEKLVKLIEKGLSSLEKNEQLVLERFYIYRSCGHVERLMEELNFEQRRIYQIKDVALYKFTINMYGIIDY
jgi:hypothetical protein